MFRNLRPDEKSEIYFLKFRSHPGTCTQKNLSPSGQRTHLRCEGKLRDTQRRAPLTEYGACDC